MNNSAESAAKIIMQGVHVELTAALQTAIREKFAAILRHNPWIVRINVRLQRDQHHGHHHHYSATGQIEVGGPDLVATVKGDDAYALIDGLAQKLDEQVRERHERRKDKRNHAPSIDSETV